MGECRGFHTSEFKGQLPVSDVIDKKRVFISEQMDRTQSLISEEGRSVVMAMCVFTKLNPIIVSYNPVKSQKSNFKKLLPSAINISNFLNFLWPIFITCLLHLKEIVRIYSAMRILQIQTIQSFFFFSPWFLNSNPVFRKEIVYLVQTQNSPKILDFITKLEKLGENYGTVV